MFIKELQEEENGELLSVPPVRQREIFILVAARGSSTRDAIGSSSNHAWSTKYHLWLAARAKPSPKPNSNKRTRTFLGLV